MNIHFDPRKVIDLRFATRMLAGCTHPSSSKNVRKYDSSGCKHDEAVLSQTIGDPSSIVKNSD